MNKTEKRLFKEAVEICEQRDFGSVPDNSELNGTHTFSEGFRAKISELSDGFEQKRAKSKIVRVIIIAAALITLAALTTFGASAIRDAGLLTVSDIFHSPVDDPFADGKNDEELAQYWVPEYIPGGFEPLVTLSEYNTVESVWARNDGAQLHLIQQRHANIMFDYDNEGTTENVNSSIQFVNNHTYYIWEYQTISMVKWTLEDSSDPRHASFLLYGNIDTGEAIQVAKSLVSADKRYNSVIIRPEDDDSAIKGHEHTEDYYRPGYIPQGFELTNERNSILGSVVEYTDADGRVIRFTQTLTSTSVMVDTENQNYDEVLVDGIKYSCFTGKGGGYNGNTIMWIQYGYMFKINDTSGIGLDEALAIAKSLRYERPRDDSDDYTAGVQEMPAGGSYTE